MVFAAEHLGSARASLHYGIGAMPAYVVEAVNVAISVPNQEEGKTSVGKGYELSRFMDSY